MGNCRLQRSRHTFSKCQHAVRTCVQVDRLSGGGYETGTKKSYTSCAETTEWSLCMFFYTQPVEPYCQLYTLKTWRHVEIFLLLLQTSGSVINQSLLIIWQNKSFIGFPICPTVTPKGIHLERQVKKKKKGHRLRANNGYTKHTAAATMTALYRDLS